MSHGKNIKQFKQKVRENSFKYAGTKKPSAKVQIVTKSGETDEKLIKNPEKKPSTNRPKRFDNGSTNSRPNKTFKPHMTGKPYNKADNQKNTKKPTYGKKPNNRIIKNVFFPDKMKTDATDKHIAGSKASIIERDLLNPYYAAMNTHIDNAINYTKSKCDGRTAFKVSSNRSKWNSCHAITFDIRLISMTDNKHTRDLLIYFVKSNDKNITVIITNSVADSSAIVFHYSGLAASCPIGTYLPRILESTEKLFSGIKNEKKVDDTINNNKANGGNDK